MWFWLVRSIAGSILGGASDAWFRKTAFGRWFYKKVEQVYSWAADRYGFQVLKAEDKWRKKYPHVAQKMDSLEVRMKYLESKLSKKKWWVD